MHVNKFLTHLLSRSICAVVSIIADAVATFALPAFVGVAFVAVASTDAETVGSTAAIDSAGGVFSFLLSLDEVTLMTMIGVVAIDSQKKKKDNGEDAIVDTEMWP